MGRPGRRERDGFGCQAALNPNRSRGRVGAIARNRSDRERIAAVRNRRELEVLCPDLVVPRKVTDQFVPAESPVVVNTTGNAVWENPTVTETA